MSRKALQILAAVILSVTAPMVAQGGVLYEVVLDTSPLVGHAAGPFSLEFQFNDGESTGDANNTVILSNFLFGTGGAVGAPILTGGVSGSLESGITFNDDTFFSQFSQGFTPGSMLSFTLYLSTNPDLSGTPDQFSFAILDNSGSELPSESYASSFFDVFAEIDIDSSRPLVRTFGSDTTRSPGGGGNPINLSAPKVSEAPEPGTPALSAIALAALALTCCRRRTGSSHPCPVRTGACD